MPHMEDKVSLSELGKSWERIESTTYHTGRQPNKQTGDSQPFAHALVWVSPHFKEAPPSDQALPLLQCVLLLLSQPQGRQAAAWISVKALTCLPSLLAPQLESKMENNPPLQNRRSQECQGGRDKLLMLWGWEPELTCLSSQLLLLTPTLLDTLESVLYIFLRKYHDSCLVLLFLQVLWNKNCKKIKYLKCSNKMGFFVILIYYCVPIVNMKHSYFASQGHNLYCCYI